MDFVEFWLMVVCVGVKDVMVFVCEMDVYVNIECCDWWGLVVLGGEVCGVGWVVMDFFGAAKRNGSSWLRLMMLNIRC